MCICQALASNDSRAYHRSQCLSEVRSERQVSECSGKSRGVGCISKGGFVMYLLKYCTVQGRAVQRAVGERVFVCIQVLIKM